MRERLPDRRENRATTIEWRGHQLHVCLGLTRDGRPLEVFVRASRPDSDLDQLADDVAIVISRALQHGDHLPLISRGLSRADGQPTSIIGALLDELLGLAGSAP